MILEHINRMVRLGFTWKEAISIWCATDLVADAVAHQTIGYTAQVEILDMIYREGAKVLTSRGLT